MLTGGKTNQIAALGIYLIWQYYWYFFTSSIEKLKTGNGLSISLVCYLTSYHLCEGTASYYGTQSLLGFVGISYLTFRSVGVIIELRDGVIKELKMREYLRFLLFMPTFSSGPIDRFKRFNENYQTIPERYELMDMLAESVRYIMWGFCINLS